MSLLETIYRSEKTGGKEMQYYLVTKNYACLDHSSYPCNASVKLSHQNSLCPLIHRVFSFCYVTSSHSIFHLLYNTRELSRILFHSTKFAC